MSALIPISFSPSSAHNTPAAMDDSASPQPQPQQRQHIHTQCSHHSPDVTSSHSSRSSHSSSSSFGNTTTTGGGSGSDPLKYLAMVAAAEMSTESSPVHSPDVAVARALDDDFCAGAHVYQQQQFGGEQGSGGRVKRSANETGVDEADDDTHLQQQYQHAALGHPGAGASVAESWHQAQQPQHHQHVHVPQVPMQTPLLSSSPSSRPAPKKRRKLTTSLQSAMDSGGTPGGGGQDSQGISDDDKQKLIADAMIVANTKSKGDKPYACAKCERSFTRKHDLIRHITVIHLNAKPFACQHPACTFSSNRKDQLVRHLKNRPVCLAFTYGHRHEFPGLMAALDQDRHWAEVVRLIQTGVNGEIILPTISTTACSKSASADAEDRDGDEGAEDEDDEAELVLGATVPSPNGRKRNKSFTAAGAPPLVPQPTRADAMAPSPRPLPTSREQQAAPRPLEPAVCPSATSQGEARPTPAPSSQSSTHVPQGLIPPLPQFLPPPPPPPPPATFGTRPLFASPPPLHPPAYLYPKSTRPASHAYEPPAATAGHYPAGPPQPPFASSAYPGPRSSNPTYPSIAPPSSHFGPPPSAPHTSTSVTSTATRPTRPPWIHQDAIITAQGFLIPFDIAHVPPRALADAWYLGRTGANGAGPSSLSPSSASMSLPESGASGLVLPPIVSASSDMSTSSDSLSTSPTRCPRPTCPTCSPASRPFPSGAALLFHLQSSHECRTYAVAHRDKVHFQLAAAIGPSWIAQLYHQYQPPPPPSFSSAPGAAVSAATSTSAAGRWPPGLAPTQTYSGAPSPAASAFVNPLPTPPSSTALAGPPPLYYAPAFPPLLSLRSTLPPLTSSSSSPSLSLSAAARPRTEPYAAGGTHDGSVLAPTAPAAHASPYARRAEAVSDGERNDGQRDREMEREREREHQQRLHGVMSDSLA